MKQNNLFYSIKRILDSSGRRFASDHLSAYAAQATFYLMLAFFPFTMLICMASRLLPFLQEDTLVRVVKLLLPAEYQTLGINLIDGYYNENIGSAKIILIIFLIWTSSRLIQALMNGFNSAYGITENRSQTVLRLVGCLYTVALCTMMVVLIAMYALGSSLIVLMTRYIPDWYFFELVIKLIRNLASPALLFFIFWLSYALLPSRSARFRGEEPGALVSALVWRGAADLYGVFLKLSLSRYSYVYGSLAGVVMILIWLYTCVYIWFIGAELNCWIRRHKESGIRAALHNVLPMKKVQSIPVLAKSATNKYIVSPRNKYKVIPRSITLQVESNDCAE
ncbi:MAG: YihY/virulence factor BrkB family protein [Oscillospiraceae bacterium]|nr:YihY/virulence factor BrkB family protein [Oscillospiraceae bacterium]